MLEGAVGLQDGFCLTRAQSQRISRCPGGSGVSFEWGGGRGTVDSLLSLHLAGSTAAFGGADHFSTIRFLDLTSGVSSYIPGSPLPASFVGSSFLHF